MTVRKIRISITDDHPLVCTGLINSLKQYKDIVVTGTYGKASHLMESLRQKLPDILFLDIQLPDKTGDELLPLIKEKYPSVKIIVLTSNESVFQIKLLINASADGYIFKNTAPEELRKAIDHVMNYPTEPYLTNEIREILFRAGQKDKSNSGPESLTQREIEILTLIAKEMTSHEIGKTLNIHYRTVEIYRLGIMRKLGAKNMVGMVKKAILMGIVKE